MPEGDTIYRTATVLRHAIMGRSITTAEAKELPTEPLLNRRIERVQPRGKHLLMHLDDGAAIHSHMGMTGSWHVYVNDQPWQKSKRLADIVLGLSNQVLIVCFTPKTLEYLSADGLRRHPWLNRLGPDLLDVDVDMDEILRRVRTQGDAPLGEMVMNQSVVCGIGNIYKSEVLFVCRLSPFARVSDCSDEQLLDLMRQARRLMRRNIGGHMRRTRIGREGPPMWVYGREGRPCLKCGERIVIRRQSDLGRITFFCPSCQVVELPPPPVTRSTEGA